MTSATHATLATFSIDLAREDEQRQGLEQHVIPGVRQFPGFVRGDWTLDRELSVTHVLLTYTSREAAEAMAANVRGNASNQREAGLTLQNIVILEMVASTDA